MWPGSPTGTGSRPADQLTGTAPLDASSGEQTRHRLSRAGNRRVNHMIHIAAISQMCLDSDGRVYYRRKRSEGKRPLEAIRCLIGRISDAIFRQLVADAIASRSGDVDAGPGGHGGASQISSAAGFHPHTDTSATSRTRTNDATRGLTNRKEHDLETPTTRIDVRREPVGRGHPSWKARILLAAIHSWM